LEPEDAITEHTKDETSLTTAISAILQFASTFNAVENDKDGITHFHPKLMIKDQYYPLKLKGREFLIKKSKNNIIDVYEVKK